MATLANIVQTYSQKGQAEDFENAVYNVTPWETPALTAFGRSKASAKIHRWQTDTLRAFTTNAQLEGDDSPGLEAIPATSELSNFLQISRRVIGVTGTMEVVDKYGRSSEMAYQIAKGMKELKLDIDAAICRNQAGSAGATGTARTSGGMEAWIQSNQTATTNASTNDGTAGWSTTGSINASADTTTTVMTFTETALKTVITSIWNASNGVSETLLMSGKNKALMSTSTFPGIATRFRDVSAGAKAQIVSGVDLFVSDFGTHKIVPSRQVRDRTVLVLNTDYWSVAYLRPFQTVELAKIGDHERRMLLAEWTLVSKNEKASGKLPNLATT
jgi:hypothetical protein